MFLLSNEAPIQPDKPVIFTLSNVPRPRTERNFVTQAGGIALIATKITTLGLGAVSFNIGYSFMKMFQVVEILSKLIYFPVVFEDRTEKLLFALHNLVEPIDVPEDIIVSEPYEDSVVGFNRKLSIYEERNHIL